MQFGFVGGDAQVPEPHIAITATPFPDGIAATKLPHGARWQTEPWPGVAWPYGELRSCANPYQALLKVLRAAQAAGAGLMR